ncbi:CDP-alcohol phosphatidyltransferase family protein [Amorphus coralli]|uniref:CDP-alcohol phosphatidyltransferase family protein n=1 Tax=Amorphus coralli TaxID=340680 RepID=UPI000376B162|nr:CDP-alcohol phosphatidyltransferase family protein [Amorphus coralli]
MFDARLRSLIDPPLTAAGRRIAASGLPADAITLGGFALGLAAAVAIAFGHYTLGLALVALNRVADGLDGAVARATAKTDRGGFLDIVLDFFFYGAVPFAFAVADPENNALAAAALLLSFYANGACFLAFAIFAERRGIETSAQGQKSLFYLGGLAEGGETIAAFVLMCLVPAWFPAIAWTFAAVCGISATARLIMAARVLAEAGRESL